MLYYAKPYKALQQYINWSDQMKIVLEKEKKETEAKMKTLDEALPSLSAETRNLLIKEIKEIKNKLTILDMKQKRIENIYKEL
jgi:septal ring factor EnvC (AmiA/AmiB activator)